MTSKLPTIPKTAININMIGIVVNSFGTHSAEIVSENIYIFWSVRVEFVISNRKVLVLGYFIKRVVR